MASHTVVRSKTATLTASTVDTVTVTGAFRRLVVKNHGTTRISATINGATPTVDGDDFRVIMAGGAEVVYDELEDEGSVSLDDTTDVAVKLISSGTPTYTVEAY